MSGAASANPAMPAPGKSWDTRQRFRRASIVSSRSRTSPAISPVRTPSPLRQVPANLAEPLSKLPRGAIAVAAAVVMKAHGKMDQRLQKPAVRLLGVRPDLLEHFMAFEELLRIEKFDTPLEKRPWIAARHRPLPRIGSPKR